MIKNKNVSKAIRDVNPYNTISIKGINKIQKYIHTFSGNDLDEFLKKLFKFPSSKRFFNFINQYPEDLLKIRIFKISSIKKELLWYKNIFVSYEKTINSFIQLQAQLDLLILNSKADDALEKLHEIVSLSGLSMWAIEYETHIKKELQFNSDIDYLNNIKKVNPNGIVDFFIQQLILKSESKNIYSFLGNFLTNINLMRESENDISQLTSDIADLLASYFVPLSFDDKRKINTRTISCMMNFSIVDQYLMFKKYISDKKVHNGKLEKYEYKVLEELSSIINDPELFGLINDDVHISDIKENYMSIIKSYTSANYSIVTDKINNLIKEDELSTVFTELFARTNIYLKGDTDNNLYGTLVKEIKNLIMLESNYDSIRKIESICIKFNLSKWTIPILFQLYNIIIVDNLKKTRTTKLMTTLGDKITPLSAIDFSYENLFNQINIKEEDLPLYRSFKTKKITNKKDFSLVNSYFEDYEKQSVIKIDYLKDRANYLIKNKLWLDAASFFVEKYIDNELIFNILPFEELISNIENTDNLEITIDIPIIYDIYNKKIKNDKENERRERYEDYIDTFGEYKPSVIFNNLNSIGEKEIYFLRYIAIPSIMDISVDFDSSNELKKERIEILNRLESIIDDENISLEKDNILDELIFEELKASFNSSKLYVDVESLKIDKESEYIRLYDLFDTSRKNESDNINYDLSQEEDMEKNFITLDNSEEQKIIMPSSDLSDIITQIYDRLKKDFVQNENYGLNKYLSTEIRHDVFFTQMRITFEKYNLLTEFGIDNEYEDNQFWIDEYSILSDNILEKMNNRLKEFSIDIDSLLKEANSWFNVKDIVENGGMFDYSSTYDRLRRLTKDLLLVQDFNSFFEQCMIFMWELTYESGEKIKKRLQEDFKEQLIKILDNLNSDIKNLTSHIPLNKLTDSIDLTRGQIVEDINVVSSWLNRMKEDTHKYSMVTIIKECINMFKDTIINKNIDINIKEKLDLFDISFTYIEARAIMSSVYIALNNCQKYALKKDEKYLIDIILETEDYSKFKVLIKNKIDLSKSEQKRLVSELKEKLSDEYKSLSTKEGGTGIHKIFNLLSNISDRFFIDVLIQNNEFILLIEVKYENNDN